MIKGITTSGFEFEIEEGIINDWEFVESLAEVQDNPLEAVNIIKRLLGDAQYKALKSHIKEKHGKIETTVMMLVLQEILSSKTQTKN